jgi:drug/metabolite transporter (DMT)-like permease
LAWACSAVSWQIGLTASLRFAPICDAGAARLLQLLYAVLFGWLLFGAQPALTTWAGAVLIIVSVLATLPRKRKDEEVGPLSSTEL